MESDRHEVWEYHVLHVGDARELEMIIQDGLNLLGREGWELVSVDLGTLYLKRPRTDRD